MRRWLATVTVLVLLGCVRGLRRGPVLLAHPVIVAHCSDDTASTTPGRAGPADPARPGDPSALPGELSRRRAGAASARRACAR